MTSPSINSRRLNRGVSAAAPGPDAPQLPCVEPGQQVIDRRTGETWTAIAWRPDLTLHVRRMAPSYTRTWFNYAALPWRDVVPAGRARKGRG